MRQTLYPILATALLGSAATVPAASAEDMEKIRLVKANANLNIGEDVFTMAVPKALGYFEEEGIEVELLTAQGGTQASQILLTGGAEIGSALSSSVLKLREQGGDLIGFYTLKQNDGFTVAVPTDSPIQSLEDLPGKKIGTGTIGAGGDALLAYQLKEIGIDETYTPVGLGYGPQISTAVTSKQVDGVIFWDSLFAVLENQGLDVRHIPVPIQNEIAGFQLTVRPDYAAEHEEQLVGFCRAITKAYQFTIANPEAAVDIFYEVFPATAPAGKPQEEVISEGVNVMNAWLKSAMEGEAEGAPLGTQYPERWQKAQDVYKALGVITQDSDVSEAFTSDYLDQCNDFDREAVIEQAEAYE